MKGPCGKLQALEAAAWIQKLDTKTRSWPPSIAYTICYAGLTMHAAHSGLFALMDCREQTGMPAMDNANIRDVADNTNLHMPQKP